MIVATTVAELRAVLRPRRAGSIGLVPTMGALHAGHLALVAAARAACDTVVMSIFVNPTQFDQQSDLDAYPTPVERDLAQAAAAGVDVVFLPDATEMYPAGHATTVCVAGPIAETLEGAVRGRAHFDGVATIVAKLLIAAQPDDAYFGAKDAQQVVVVRRMVADLGIPSRIRVVETVRDPDGLALSSRNARLSPPERAAALAMPRALDRARRLVTDGRIGAPEIVATVTREMQESGLDIEYVAVVDPDDLAPLSRVAGPALLAVAVRAGETRLIDNVALAPVAPGADAGVDVVPGRASSEGALP